MKPKVSQKKPSAGELTPALRAKRMIGSSGRDVPLAGESPIAYFLRVVDERECHEDEEDSLRRSAYEMVANGLRGTLLPLTADEVLIVAGWFDRLAAGEDARKIFYQARKVGRPRGTSKRRIVGSSILDDRTIEQVVRYNAERIKSDPRILRRERARGVSPMKAIYVAVGKAAGLDWQTVRRICARVKKQTKK